MNYLSSLLVLFISIAFSDWKHTSIKKEEKDLITLRLTIDKDVVTNDKDGKQYTIPEGIEDILTPDLSYVYLTYSDTVHVFDPVDYTETVEVTTHMIPVNIIGN